MVSQFNVVLETQQKSKPMVATKEIKTEATPLKKRTKKIVKQRAISVKRNSKLKSTTLVRKPKALKQPLDINEVENEKVIREEQVAFVSPSISTDINNRKPYYPQVARRRGMQGNVLLQVSVGIHGEVLDVVIKQSSGYLLLDEAAKETIKEWQFQPAQRDGKLEIGRIEIPIRFNLQNS
jgi:protein TonB